MLSFLKKIIGNQRIKQAKERHLFSDVNLSLVAVGDVLIRKADLSFKRHHAHYGSDQYTENIRFTAGKEYPIVRIKLKSRTVFLVDDGGLVVPINRYQQRNFDFRPVKASIYLC